MVVQPELGLNFIAGGCEKIIDQRLFQLPLICLSKGYGHSEGQLWKLSALCMCCPPEEYNEAS